MSISFRRIVKIIDSDYAQASWQVAVNQVISYPAICQNKLISHLPFEEHT